jgi:hypothetical protein
VPDPLGTALTGYQSPNTSLVDDSRLDLEACAELERLRGIKKRDYDVYKALSWAIRKDKEIHVGIAIETADLSSGLPEVSGQA